MGIVSWINEVGFYDRFSIDIEFFDLLFNLAILDGIDDKSFISKNVFNPNPIFRHLLLLIAVSDL